MHNFFSYEEGPPKYLQTDNGTEFIAEVSKNLCSSLNVKVIHGRPYHPESQGQVENLNKRVKKKMGHLLCQKFPDEQAKLWPYLLPLIAREINTTWHHTIQDVPFQVFKGRSSGDFYYPNDEEFFDQPKHEEDDKFLDNDLLSETSDQCEAHARPDNGEETDDETAEPFLSFSERLNTGCSLARIREHTRLRALEATERMIANNTRQISHLGKARAAVFCRRCSHI